MTKCQNLKFKNFSLKIKEDKYFVFTFVSFLSIFFIFLNFSLWHSPWMGFLFLAVYLFINATWLNKILSKIIPSDFYYRPLFGFYFLLILIAFAGAIFIVLWKITPFIMISIFLVLTLIFSFLNRKNFEDFEKINEITKTKNVKDPGKKIKILEYLKQNKQGYLFFCFFILLFFGFWFLWKARTGSYILHPWQVIHPIYLYLYFFITFIIVFLILEGYLEQSKTYSLDNSRKKSTSEITPQSSIICHDDLIKFKTKIILLIIILFSFLTHAYLPIVYKVGFGGDRWRHLGAEKYLQEGKIYSPALFGQEIKWQEFGPIKIPKVFVAGNKTSYASQWALTIFLSWILGIDVFWIDIFLLFFLWSIFIPLFLFKLAKLALEELKSENQKWKTETFPLLLAFLPTLFYPFQIYGSITLPTGFGFLSFLFILILYFSLLRQKEADQNLLNKKSKLFFLFWFFFFVILLYFNYALYFILFLGISLTTFLLKKIQKKKSLLIILFLLLIIYCFFIPFLDTFYSLTRWKSENFSQPLLFSGFLKEFVKKLLGFESLPLLPIHITQGNFIYMQTGESLSPSTLLSLIPWSIIISSMIWGFIIYALFDFKKKKKSVLITILVLFLFIALGNQFISTYFMEGVHVLSKRLDLFIAFLMLFFLGWGTYNFVTFSPKFITHRAKVIFICIFFALTSVSTYASGPKLEMVTEDELKAAQYIWQRLKDKDPKTKYCVLANTWPLLALEAVSGRKIITGGFPVYREYAQPERVRLFKGMSYWPSVRYLEKAFEITNSSSCYFMTERRFWTERVPGILEKLMEIFGEYEKIGEVYIFFYH